MPGALNYLRAQGESIVPRPILIGLVMVLTTAVLAVAFWVLAGEEPERSAAPQHTGRFGDAPGPVVPLSESFHQSLQSLGPPAPSVTGAARRPPGKRPAPLGSLGVRDDDPPLAADVPRAARLLGHVYRHWAGAPVVDVAVRAELAADDPLADQIWLVNTDAAGRFLFDFPQDVQLKGLHVAALEAGEASTRALSLDQDVTLVWGGLHEVWMEVPDAGQLVGRVVDEAGQAVAGATVFTWDGHPSRPRTPSSDPPVESSVVTGGDGHFALPTPERRFVVSAEAPGLVCATPLHGETRPGQSVEGLLLVLHSAHPLDGVVSGPAGEPLAGVQVSARPASSHPEALRLTAVGATPFGVKVVTKTDQHGAYHFETLAGQRLLIRAISPRHLSESQLHDPRNGPLHLELAGGASIAGTVRGLAGEPVTGAQVQLRVVGYRTTTTDTDGRFALLGLEEASCLSLLVTAPGHAVQVVQVPDLQAEEGRLLEVTLEAARALGGRVVDVEGVAVAGARVVIEGDRRLGSSPTWGTPQTWEREFGLHQAHTDHTGRFRIDGLYEGQFQVSADDPLGDRGADAIDVSSGDLEIQLKLLPRDRPTAMIVGSVRDALTDRPVTRFDVMLQTLSWRFDYPRRREEVHDAQGRFACPGVELGHVRVVVEAEGYLSWSAILSPPVVAKLDVLLQAGRCLWLRLIDERGEPHVGVTVRFRDEDGQPLVVEGGPTGGFGILLSDGHGEVRACGLPAGLVKVTSRPAPPASEPEVSVFDYGEDLTTTVDLTEEPALVQTIVMPRPELRDDEER